MTTGEQLSSSDDQESDKGRESPRKKQRLIHDLKDEDATLWWREECGTQHWWYSGRYIDNPTAEEHKSVCTQGDTFVGIAFLDVMAQEFEQDEQTGPEINQKLAGIFKNCMSKKPDDEKLQTALDSYYRAQNGYAMASAKVNPDLVSVKVNPKIWA